MTLELKPDFGFLCENKPDLVVKPCRCAQADWAIQNVFLVSCYIMRTAVRRHHHCILHSL